MPIIISARKNGPFLIEGDFSELVLADSDGNPFEFEPLNAGGKQQLYLCRCGASVMKPFCDGTHGKIGFAAAEEAINNPD